MHKYFAPRMARGLNDDEEEEFPLNLQSGDQELSTLFQYETTSDPDFDDYRNHSKMSIRSHETTNYCRDDNQQEISCSGENDDWRSPSIGNRHRNDEINNITDDNFHEEIYNDGYFFDNIQNFRDIAAHNSPSTDKDRRVRPTNNEPYIYESYNDEPVGSRHGVVREARVIFHKECAEEEAFLRCTENCDAQDLLSFNQNSPTNAYHHSNANNHAAASVFLPSNSHDDIADRYLPHPPPLQQIGNLEGRLQLEMDLQNFDEKQGILQRQQLQLQQIEDKVQPVSAVSDRIIIEAASFQIEEFRRKYFCGEYRDMVKVFASKKNNRERQAANSLISLGDYDGDQISNFGGSGSEGSVYENTLTANEAPNLDESEIKYYDAQDFFTDPPDWCPKTLNQFSRHMSSKDEKTDSEEVLIVPLSDDLKRNCEESREIGHLLSDEKVETDYSHEDAIDIYFDAKECRESLPNIEVEELDVQDPMAMIHHDDGGADWLQKGTIYQRGTCVLLEEQMKSISPSEYRTSMNTVLSDIDPSPSTSLPSACHKSFYPISTSRVGATESKQPILAFETYRTVVARACLNFPVSLLSSVSAMFGTANVPDSATLITGCQASALIPTARHTAAYSSTLDLNHTVSSDSASISDNFLSPVPSIVCSSVPDTPFEIGVSTVRLSTPVTFSATFLLPGALDSDTDSDADTDIKGDSDGTTDRAHCDGEKDGVDLEVRNKIIEQQPNYGLEYLGRPALENGTSLIEVRGLPIASDKEDCDLLSNADPVLSCTRNSALKRGSVSSAAAVEVGCRVDVMDSVPQISSSPTPQIMINGRLINLGQNPFSSDAPNLLSCGGPCSHLRHDYHDTPLQDEFPALTSGNCTSNRLAEEGIATDSCGPNDAERGKDKVALGVRDDFSRFKYSPMKNGKLIGERTSSAMIDIPPLSCTKFKEGIRQRKGILSAFPSALSPSSHYWSAAAPVDSEKAQRSLDHHVPSLYKGAMIKEIVHETNETVTDKRKRGEFDSRNFDEAGERRREECSDSGSNVDSDDDLPCATCLELDPWEGDPMVFCEGVCGMCVHIKCYGLIEAPQGDFFCESCTEGKRLRAAVALASREGRSSKRRDKIGKKPRCVLCKNSSGMMKRSSCGQWCHPLCVLFTGTSIFPSL